MATGRVNVGGGSGGASLNIYSQLNEPSKKEGLWIETTDGFKDIYFQKNVYKADTFAEELQERTPSIITNTGAIAVHKGFLYVWGATASTPKANKFNLRNRTWSSIPINPGIVATGRCFIGGDKIYILHNPNYNMQIIEFDTITETYRIVGSYPITGNAGQFGFAKYGNTLNIATNASSSPYPWRASTIDLSDGSVEVLSGPMTGASTSSRFAVIGNKYYQFGTDRVANFVYDSETNERTSIADSVYVGAGASFEAIGSDIYMVGGTAQDKVAIYNTIGDTWTLTDAKMATNRALHTSFYSESEKALFVSNGYTTMTSVHNGSFEVLKFEDKQFTQDDLIIQYVDDKLRLGNFETQLFTSKQMPTNVRLLTAMLDFWIFKNAELRGYPSYYGDGTQWIKFKN